MNPHDLPIALRPGGAPLEERVLAELPADYYSLEELRLIVSVLEKYVATVQLIDARAAGSVQ